jgi:hypothetical protein
MSEFGRMARIGLAVILPCAVACSGGEVGVRRDPGGGATGGTFATGGSGGSGGLSAGSGGMAASSATGGTLPGLAGMPTIIMAGSGGAAGGDMMAGAAGQGGRTVTAECAASKATATDMTTVVPADIIFAIDSSSSMRDEIVFVQTFMNAFSQQISAAGVDPRVILIGDPEAICIGAPLGTGMCPADENLPTYVHVPANVGSNDALNVIVDTYPMWSQHLRPNASKSFVVVTDDDATDAPNDSAATFAANLTALDPVLWATWNMNGVFCFTECNQAAAVGTVYQELVTMTEGVSGDLCLQDFQPVFDKLAEQIVMMSGSEITCEWPFPAAPAGQSFSGDLVTVERSAGGAKSPLAQVASGDDCVAGGWYFDSRLNPTKIIACPTTCTELQGQTGGQVDVTFGCEAVGSCVATDATTIENATAVCAWNLPLPPSGQALDLTAVNVRYTSASGLGSNIGKVGSMAECAMFLDGWYFDDPAAPKQIVACPQTCSEIQAGAAGAKVDVLFGCMTKPPVTR